MNLLQHSQLTATPTVSVNLEIDAPAEVIRNWMQGNWALGDDIDFRDPSKITWATWTRRNIFFWSVELSPHADGTTAVTHAVSFVSSARTTARARFALAHIGQRRMTRALRSMKSEVEAAQMTKASVEPTGGAHRAGIVRSLWALWVDAGYPRLVGRLY